MPDQTRRANLTAALGFLQFPPRAPELRLLHRWLDTWTGLGLAVVRSACPVGNSSIQHSPRRPSDGWRRCSRIEASM